VIDGELLNATASISTLDVDGRLQAGGEYDQGERRYFDQGEASSGYQISRIEDGEIGPSATQFQTAANGTAIVDTAALDEGQYAITRVDDGSLVGLDNDSTTGPGDDSFLVTGQQVGPANGTNGSANTTANGTTNATNGTTNATNGTTNATANGTANATTTEAANTTAENGSVTTTDAVGENATGTTGETSTAATTTAASTAEANATAAETNASGDTNGSGQATEEGGPGFTAIAAVVAVLAAALLATRRR
jgi:PGF-CTERM protein